jgi:hypothetical protein
VECDPAKKPDTTQACGCKDKGTQTRTVTCNTVSGAWNTPSAWGDCSISDKCECDNATKPPESQACSECGIQTRTVICDDSGNWTQPAFGNCIGQKSESEKCGSGYSEYANKYRLCNNNVWGNWDMSHCTIDVCFNNIAHGGVTFKIGILGPNDDKGDPALPYTMDVINTLCIDKDSYGNPLEPNKFYNVYYMITYAGGFPGIIHSGTISNGQVWNIQ